jgi:hypothetical protein
MFPGQLHKNCIIGGATGATFLGIYATYSYTHATALKAENKKLKQEIYELKRQKWIAENSKSEPESAINKYDSYDLTDENNKDFVSKKTTPNLVISDLPALNMISDDEGASASASASSASVPVETSTSEEAEEAEAEGSPLIESPSASASAASASAASPSSASASSTADVLYAHESCTCQTPRNVIIGMIDLFVLASAVYIYIFATHLNDQCPA